jgi:hypothetical protein
MTAGSVSLGESRPTRRLNQPHRAQDCQVIAVPPDQVWRRAPVELINAQPGDHGVGAAAHDADWNAGFGSGVGEQARSVRRGALRQPPPTPSAVRAPEWVWVAALRSVEQSAKAAALPALSAQPLEQAPVLAARRQIDRTPPAA